MLTDDRIIESLRLEKALRVQPSAYHECFWESNALELDEFVRQRIASAWFANAKVVSKYGCVVKGMQNWLRSFLSSQGGMFP